MPPFCFFVCVCCTLLDGACASGPVLSLRLLRLNSILEFIEERTGFAHCPPEFSLSRFHAAGKVDVIDWLLTGLLLYGGSSRIAAPALAFIAQWQPPVVSWQFELLLDMH